jgi:cellobiose phosphorylase
MKRSFGYFQNNGTEFVVTEYDTPRGLANYSWNAHFVSGWNQHGGGEGVYKERPMQYIDPRGRNIMVRDTSRCFFLRDHANGEVWSPGWSPVKRKLDQCRTLRDRGVPTGPTPRDPAGAEHGRSLLPWRPPN